MSDFLSQLQYIVSISHRKEIEKSLTGEMNKGQSDWTTWPYPYNRVYTMLGLSQSRKMLVW